MNEYFSNGETIHFDHETLRIYMETTLSQNQRLLHQINSRKLEFYSEDKNWSYARKSSKVEYDIELKINFDNSISYDGYKLDIAFDLITITVSTYRGVIYAINRLEELFVNQTLPHVSITEIPSVEYRGVIEGFYGLPWTHDNRLDLIDFLIENRLNTYFYAPKDDIYHRDLWREEYPVKEQQKLQELINKSNQNHVNFIYAISPGKDIDIANDNDIKEVSNKLLTINKLGVTNFALLMDDINYDLNEFEQKVYQRPGIAHSILANKVYEEMKKHIIDFDFYICPTEYWQNWDTPYRKDMKRYLHKDINCFFTGYHTIAQSIPQKDLQIAYESFGHPLAIWDNYPTNDVNRDRLYLNAICNRTKELSDNFVNCYVANPMNQYNMSKFALLTVADYLWDPSGYNEEISLSKAIQTLSTLWNSPYENLELFVRLNKSTRLRKTEMCDLVKSIDTFNVKELNTHLDKLKETSIALKQLDHFILSEIEAWVSKLDDEIIYLEQFIQNKRVEIKESTVNLGFNFGSYAQNKKGE